jgi:protoheme IX farnesyltransferase
MKNKFSNKFRYYLELCKLKIMIPVSITGFTGYFIFDSHLTLKTFLLSFGILLLAVSASVLNQMQEVEIDRSMKRTQHRPIPTGTISARQATIFFLILLTAGSALIFFYGNLTSLLIGLFTIIWYNGIYTYFKRITAFAVIPGAITGALPPLIGWVAAGGGWLDKQIIFVEFLFFVGQVPHFWLLVLKYGEEYEKAGIPSLTCVLGRSQINRLTFTWVVTSVISALLLCSTGIIKTGLIIGILLGASIIIIWQFSDLLKITGEKRNSRKYSILLDSYFLLVLLLLISDRIMN